MLGTRLDGSNGSDRNKVTASFSVEAGRVEGVTNIARGFSVKGEEENGSEIRSPQHELDCGGWQSRKVWEEGHGQRNKQKSYRTQR